MNRTKKGRRSQLPEWAAIYTKIDVYIESVVGGPRNAGLGYNDSLISNCISVESISSSLHELLTFKRHSVQNSIVQPC